jgi:ABC-2 type transport system ATP-binding protein
MIELSNLSKNFGDKTAVKQVNLKVTPGEIFAFLGPNGAGKTTTIKMMVGLLQPTTGTVSICGFDMRSDYIAAKHALAYVPDQPYLYDKLSGHEFLEFVGRMYGLPPAETELQIARYSEIFELKEYLDDLTENYSHGMKQRVVFASALLHSPKVLILDEPMVGLDPKSTRLVKNLLRDISKQGVSVFMSTHTLDVAEEVAHRIGIISVGEMIALGSLDELRSTRQQQARLEELFLSIVAEEEESKGSVKK